MKKNMYSLMLAEDVIRAIDELASEKNTNRSNGVTIQSCFSDFRS